MQSPADTLFPDLPSPPRHHAGGKSTFPMLPGTCGWAEFRGERQEHRVLLGREWGTTNGPSRYALWAGMNPSTGRHDMDDLTVRKDQVFTHRVLRLHRMFKVNAGSYCCTDPAGLAAAGLELCHPENLSTVRRLAADAAVIVMATGSVPKVLIPYARAMFDALKADGRKMLCLGLTADGWPKHSSRLGYSTPFVEFNP